MLSSSIGRGSFVDVCFFNFFFCDNVCVCVLVVRFERVLAVMARVVCVLLCFLQ